jgi:predicted transposase/invertase (TIGR01784 family)
MRRDTIFYRIFQQFPSLLFELIPNPPANATTYRFDSVEVKETAFRLDGVFIPPDRDGIVYFGEVQFQKDELFYERLMSESWVYFFRHRE